MSLHPFLMGVPLPQDSLAKLDPLTAQKYIVLKGIYRLRRFPLNVRAVSAKIKLPKKYLQHCHILRTDKKNLSLLLLPS